MKGLEKEHQEKWLTARFILLTGLSCIVTICLQMMVTAMPLLTVEWGYDPAVAGVSTTVCTLAALLSRPMSVHISMKAGERGCALIGSAFYAVVFLSCFFNSDLPGLIFLRGIQGFGMSLLTTSLGAMVTAGLPKSRMTEGMAYFGLGNAVALSIGPSIGLILSQNSGFSALFLFGFILSILTLLAVLFLQPFNRSESPSSPAAANRKNFFQLMIESGSLLPSLSSSALIFCQVSLSTYLAFWGEVSSLTHVSTFFSVNLFGMIVSRLCIGWLGRFSKIRICIISSILLSFSYFLIALFPSEMILWIAGIAYGFGYGILYAQMNAAAVQYSSRETRDTANAVFFGAKDMGTALGAFIWGMLIGAFGYQSIFLLDGIIVLVGSIGFTYWRTMKQRKEVDTHEGT